MHEDILWVAYGVLIKQKKDMVIQKYRIPQLSVFIRLKKNN